MTALMSSERDFQDFLTRIPAARVLHERFERDPNVVKVLDYELKTGRILEALKSGSEARVEAALRADRRIRGFRSAKKRNRPAIAPGRQLEIALAALAAQEAREGGTEVAA